MKQIIATFAVLVSFSTISAQSIPAKLNELMTAYAQLDKFNGSVLVTQNGTILLNKGYGKADFGTNLDATPATQYQIGSVTKQFTAAVIMRLQEQGKLKVTDKLSTYIKDFPQGDKITIENLLQHTSGIFNYTNDGAFMQTGVTKSYNSEEMISRFKQKPLDFEPGTQWSYSNSGYFLLGYIIEKVTGKPYEKIMREFIFQPTGMTHSGFDFTHLTSADKATGYLSFSGASSLKSPIVDSTVSSAAGAIYSTTGDLNLWAQAVLQQKILKPASWKASFQANKNNYAYGWSRDSIQSRPAYSHGGGIHGFNSHLAILPEEKLTIIVLSNINTPLLEEITRNLAAIPLGKTYELPKGRSEISLGEDALKEYPGEYELAPTFKLTVRFENGKLTAQATGQQAFELFAEKKDFFFLKVVDAQVEFKRNDQGQIDGLILHQNGRAMPAKKN